MLAACKRSDSWVLAEVFSGQLQDWNTHSEMCIHSCGVPTQYSSSLFLGNEECISLPELDLVSLWTWKSIITHKLHHWYICLNCLVKWSTLLFIIRWISRRNVLSFCGRVRRRPRSLCECLLTADGLCFLILYPSPDPISFPLLFWKGQVSHLPPLSLLAPTVNYLARAIFCHCYQYKPY